MPIHVFGNSSSSKENGIKIDTSLFVQKPYPRTNYIESNVEEDIDLGNQYKNKKWPDPISTRETVSKKFVDNKINDPSIKKNTAHVNFNDKNLDNVFSIKVNSMPTLEEHLTLKCYVYNATFIA